MNKQKNKKKSEPVTISTQLPLEEIDDIRDLCELTGHKLSYILRVLVRVGADKINGMPETHGRTIISERGSLSEGE